MIRWVKSSAMAAKNNQKNGLVVDVYGMFMYMSISQTCMTTGYNK